MANQTEKEYQVNHLYDLTKIPEHKNIPLSDIWMDILSEIFPKVNDQISQQSICSYRLMPSGNNAKVVIRCLPLIWALTTAVATVAVLSQQIETKTFSWEQGVL
ncbi:MAG: hypothetical protein GY737_16860 [Desulfobacteraceae bacterium]|nr:hypothetical protein [Desulfobacteraceae bacterium]